MTKVLKWNVPSEKQIESAVLYYLNYQVGCMAFKVDTRANYDVRLGTYRSLSKHIMPGTPDILCCYSVQCVGVFIGFEVKAEKGRQSQHQVAFQEKLQDRANGFYFIIKSVKDAEDALASVTAKITVLTNINK